VVVLGNVGRWEEDVFCMFIARRPTTNWWIPVWLVKDGAPVGVLKIVQHAACSSSEAGGGDFTSYTTFSMH